MTSINVRPPEAVYDPSLNTPTANQEDVAEALFEFVQAVRVAAVDGKLTAAEIFQIAVGNVPGAVNKIVALLRDEVALDEDLENVGHVMFRQLTAGV